MRFYTSLTKLRMGGYAVGSTFNTKRSQESMWKIAEVCVSRKVGGHRYEVGTFGDLWPLLDKKFRRARVVVERRFLSLPIIAPNGRRGPHE